MITEVVEATDRDRVLTDEQTCHVCGVQIGCVLHGDVPTYETFLPYYVVRDVGEAKKLCEQCCERSC